MKIFTTCLLHGGFNTIGGLKPTFRPFELIQRGDIFALLASLEDSPQETKGPDSFPVPLLEEAYWATVLGMEEDSKTIAIASIELTTPWTSGQMHLQKYRKLGRPREDFEAKMSEISARAEQYGATLTVEIQELETPSHKAVLDAISTVGDDATIEGLAEWHSIEVKSEYHNRKVSEALLHANLEYQCTGSPDAANNVGYLSIATDDLDEARQYLQTSVAGFESNDDPNEQLTAALPMYNLGVVALKSNDIEGAREYFKQSVALAKKRDATDNACMVLFLPKLVDGATEWTELESPDLLDTARKALRVANRLDT